MLLIQDHTLCLQHELWSQTDPSLNPSSAFLAVKSLVSYLISLSLSFLAYKKIKITYFIGLL